MVLSEVTLNRLKSQHELIQVFISGMCEAELKSRPIPDKWSVHENIAHLACYQLRVLNRTQRVLSEDNPTFENYVPEEDPEFPKFLTMTVDQLLANQKEKRSEIVNLISNLTNVQLERIGNHPKFGKMTITEWTEFFLLHEAHHIYTIFQLIRLLKK
jgi:uncharacterized damage-inducible protein DinB